MATKYKKLFREDYLFKGRYTTMVNDLVHVVDQQSGTQIFNSAVELFLVSAIVGISYDKQAEPDKGDPTFRIMTAQFSGHYDPMVFVFRLVMLNAGKDTLSAVDRINNAFRYTESDPEFQQNIDTFERYMLGGLTILHDKFIKSTNTHYDDYRNSLDELISEMRGVKEEPDDSDVIDFSPAF